MSPPSAQYRRSSQQQGHDWWMRGGSSHVNAKNDDGRTLQDWMNSSRHLAINHLATDPLQGYGACSLLRAQLLECMLVMPPMQSAPFTHRNSRYESANFRRNSCMWLLAHDKVVLWCPGVIAADVRLLRGCMIGAGGQGGHEVAQ